MFATKMRVGTSSRQDIRDALFGRKFTVLQLLEFSASWQLILKPMIFLQRQSTPAISEVLLPASVWTTRSLSHLEDNLTRIGTHRNNRSRSEGGAWASTISLFKHSLQLNCTASTRTVSLSVDCIMFSCEVLTFRVPQ